MSDQTLQVTEPQAEVTTEPSLPTEDVKPKVEEGEAEGTPEAETKEDAAEGEGDNSKPEEISELEKTRHAMQKRIDRQTAARKADQEQIRQLNEQLAELRERVPKADDAPKQEDFDSYEDWEQASIEHKAKLRAEEVLQAEKQKELEAVQQRQQAEVRRKFEESEDAFRTTAPDYDHVAKEAVETLNSLQATGVDITPLRDAVMQFDNPPQMIYELGKDTDLIEELVHMAPLKAMRELIKLEIALEGKAKAEPKTAPAPIKPTGGKGSVKPLAQRSAKEVLEWVKT
jgi:chromosome segregation ATPase